MAEPEAPEFDRHCYVNPVRVKRAFRPECAFVCLDEVDARKDWLMPPHVHDGFELMHVLTGTYACRVNGTATEVQPGETLMIRPGDLHEDAAGSPCSFLATRFLLLGVHRYPEQFELFANVSAQDLIFRNTESLLAAFHKRVLAELATPGPFTASLLDAHTLTLFWELLNRLPTARLWKDVHSTQQNTLEFRLLELFHDQRDATLSVNEIAKHLGMSVSSLERSCKRELNISVGRALMRFRMEEALELIRHTATPIKEVSELLGFQNQNHFSSTFSKHFGRAPSTFRSAGTPSHTISAPPTQKP